MLLYRIFETGGIGPSTCDCFFGGSIIKEKKGQFRFDKRWIGQVGLMESIVMGWTKDQDGQSEDFITKINNCRHEISSWRKDNPPYGKDKILNLHKALEEVQTDNNRSQEDIIEISRKLQEAYKDEEEYWHQKSRNMWFSYGDLNTKFYHASTKKCRIRNKWVSTMKQVTGSQRRMESRKWR